MTAEPAKSVFLNCPFDREFSRLFDALVFATVSCGFLPRSALESGTVAASRMDRITRALFSSKYSIHDLSRCRGEGEENIARFNMPLELGIAMAERYRSREVGWQHDWLLLVPAGHQYVKFLSDLAGFDPKTYDGSEADMVLKVVSWLATRPDTVETPTPREVLARLPAFLTAKERLVQEWGGDIPWADLVVAAFDTAPGL